MAKEESTKAYVGEELGEPLLMPWMPSISELTGALPPEVHVVGFGKTASVFSSKQKPKELTIYGSDFRFQLLYLATCQSGQPKMMHQGRKYRSLRTQQAPHH